MAGYVSVVFVSLRDETQPDYWRILESSRFEGNSIKIKGASVNNPIPRGGPRFLGRS